MIPRIQRLEAIFARIQKLPRDEKEHSGAILAMLIGALKVLTDDGFTTTTEKLADDVVDALDRAVKFEEQSGPSAKPEDTK